MNTMNKQHFPIRCDFVYVLIRTKSVFNTIPADTTRNMELFWYMAGGECSHTCDWTYIPKKCVVPMRHLLPASTFNIRVYPGIPCRKSSVLILEYKDNNIPIYGVFGTCPKSFHCIVRSSVTCPAQQRCPIDRLCGTSGSVGHRIFMMAPLRVENCTVGGPTNMYDPAKKASQYCNRTQGCQDNWLTSSTSCTRRHGAQLRNLMGPEWLKRSLLQGYFD